MIRIKEGSRDIFVAQFVEYRHVMYTTYMYTYSSIFM